MTLRDPIVWSHARQPGRGAGARGRLRQHPVRAVQPDEALRRAPRAWLAAAGQPGADELAGSWARHAERRGQRLVSGVVTEDHDALAAQLVAGAAAAAHPLHV